MAELKKDGIRAAMSESVERETLKRMSQRPDKQTDDSQPALESCPFCPARPSKTQTEWWFVRHERECFISIVAQRDMFIRPDHVAAWNTRARVDGGVAVDRVFEAKLLGFEDDWRIRLCETCVRRATEDNFVIFSCALPLDATTPPLAAPVDDRDPKRDQQSS